MRLSTLGRPASLLAAATMIVAACAPAAPASPPQAPAQPAASAAPAASPATAAPAAASPAAQAASSGSSASGALVRAELGSLAKTLHPYPDDSSYTSTWTDIAALIWGGGPGGFGHGGLIMFNWDKLQYEPGMAKDLPKVSNGGKTYTFTLRDDVKWSDGSPVTVDDFLFAWENASKKENAWVGWDQTQDVESFKAPDKSTIEVTLKQAKPGDVGLGLANLISPVPSKVWKGKPWNDPTANPEILTPSVVMGPYKIQEFKIAERAVLTAIDTYFYGKPKIQRIEFVPAGQPTVVFEMLRSGKANWVPQLPPALFKDAKADPNINAFNWTAANAGYRLLQFNLARPVFKDKAFREALSRSLNRADMIDVAEEGLGTAQYSFITPANTKWTNPNVEKYDFDVAKAKQLLEQAGYKKQGDKLIGKDGQPVKIQVIYPTTSSPRAKIATYMQQQYKDLGIELEVKGVDFNAYTDTVSKRQDFDIALGSYGGGDIDPDLSSKAQLISDGQQNRQTYGNPKVDDLFKQGQNELDEAKRKQIYNDIQKLVADDLPSFYLYSYQSPTAASKKVQGMTPTKGDRLYYNDATLAWSVAQ